MAGPLRISSIDPNDAADQSLLRRWRKDVPVCLLHSPSSGRPNEDCLLAACPRGWLFVDHLGLVSHSGTDRTIQACAAAVDEHPSDPLESLQHALQISSGSDKGSTGFWITILSYDLGRIIEPVAAAGAGDGAKDDRNWPLLAMAWCPDRMVFNRSAGTWHVVGNQETIASWFSDTVQPVTGFEVEPFASSFTQQEYLNAVQRVIDYISQGDIFQANLTQRFHSQFSGSSRELACRAFAHSQPRYGAYLELPPTSKVDHGRCVISMSPELFLDVDGDSRDVVTRPIKGTRPASGQMAAEELRDSIKDQAELHMIVDLMRNDLGRVCRFGSIAVTEPRSIESHPTVHHGVSTIRGRLRDDVSISDLLRASFPGGSITGAPKIRAMQIIDQIEPVRRGAYCGSIGWIDANQSARMNIAIRTICLTGQRNTGDWDRLTGVLDYGAGGGIVADSEPLCEYQESIDKAEVLRLAIMGDRTALPRRQPVPQAL